MVPLLLEADFRDPTPNDVCTGLTLDDGIAPAALVTGAIDRFTRKLNDYTNDSFQQQSLTIDMDGGGSALLLLPKRCVMLTQIFLRDDAGVLTLQNAAAYRFSSSLYADGSKRAGELDVIEVVPAGVGLTGGPTGSDTYRWPAGPQTVQVIGAFGWTTAPFDILRALALMVYHHFKPLRGDLRLATRTTTADQITEFDLTEPTGIPEADEIIATYKRTSMTGIG